MLRLRKIAVTGGMSSGKSTVCHFLKELGAYVVSADEIVHELLFSDPNVRSEVLDLLGKDVLENDRLNRNLIAKKVFPNPPLLTKLENILHPRVFKEIQRHYESIKTDPKYSLFVAEVPLLYEKGQEKTFDSTILVLCEDKTRLSRQTNNANQRTKRFMSDKDKAKKADFLINNNESLAALKNQITKLFQTLRSI